MLECGRGDVADDQHHGGADDEPRVAERHDQLAPGVVVARGVGQPSEDEPGRDHERRPRRIEQEERRDDDELQRRDEAGTDVEGHAGDDRERGDERDEDARVRRRRVRDRRQKARNGEQRDGERGLDDRLAPLGARTAALVALGEQALRVVAHARFAPATQPRHRRQVIAHGHH